MSWSSAFLFIPKKKTRYEDLNVPLTLMLVFAPGIFYLFKPDTAVFEYVVDGVGIVLAVGIFVTRFRRIRQGDAKEPKKNAPYTKIEPK